MQDNKTRRPYLPEGMLSGTPELKNLLRNRDALEKAAADGTILEAPCILCDGANMRLTVALPNGFLGVMPREEVCWQPDGQPCKDIAIITRVGRPVQFKIRDISESPSGQVTALLSRRDAQRECAEQYLAHLRPGDLLPARVTHLEPFGAFCDIGCGMIALLTVDRMSVSRIAHPSDRFAGGDVLQAVVSQVEDNGRLYLSCRELLGTWEENAAFFAPGQTVRGIIRSVEEYGVFVELAPNLAGLAERFDGAVPGEACSVYIKSILPERMKIKLVMIEPCGRAERMPLRYFVDVSAVHHIDRWQYSPPGCRRVVETVFAPCPEPAAVR